MHGQITLDSELGKGTKATFWVPFNRPQFGGNQSPLVDLGAIPDRLRSEMSVSGCASDMQNGSPTPPMSPQDSLAVAHSHQKSKSGSGLSRVVTGDNSDAVAAGNDINRSKTHVLVVEDK